MDDYYYYYYCYTHTSVELCLLCLNVNAQNTQVYTWTYIRAPCVANRVNRPNECKKKKKNHPKIIYSCGVTRTVHKYCHLVDQLLIEFRVYSILSCWVFVRRNVFV